MKNLMSKKLDVVVQPGVEITGKWHNRTWRIKQKLGSGAIGSVYLCVANGKQAALKISEKNTSMTMEVNVLKSFAKVQGARLGPYLMDVDDWEAPNGMVYAFYVMEYLRGESIRSFIKKRGDVWLGVFMLQLLDDLEQLHQNGWVFGDLKTDNLLVVHSPIRIRWVDVGGTTQIGRSIKEYTEFFDRGYWEMGSRRAEPGYDLFAFVMVCLDIAYPKRFAKGTRPQLTLEQKINHARILQRYRKPLKKAIRGDYLSSAEMKRDIIQILDHLRPNNRRNVRQRYHSTQLMLVESGVVSLMALIFYLISLLLA